MEKKPKIDISSEFNLFGLNPVKIRESAKDIHLVFESLVDAGFTEEQAMQIICTIFASLGKRDA